MNIQTRFEPNLGGGSLANKLNTSSHAALSINTSSVFILFTGGGWKCQNAQGKVVFMTSVTWPDVPSRRNSPEKLFAFHFQPSFANSHGRTTIQRAAQQL